MKGSRLAPRDRAAASESAKPPRPEPSPEAIAVRAYELYLARGGADGSDLDDWLQAERDLRGRVMTRVSTS